MRFDSTKVYNFEGAFRGMRNPMNSWNKSDSYFGITDDYDETFLTIAEEYARKECPEYDNCNDDEIIKLEDKYADWLIKNEILDGQDMYANVALIGPNDLELAQKLIKAGPEHCKFLRQIFVSVDITAPLYW